MIAAQLVARFPNGMTSLAILLHVEQQTGSYGAAGIVLLIWALLTLRGHGTTFLPDAGATTLVTTGPYRRFRNPIYLADTMILLGAAEITKNIWLVIAAAGFAALVTWLAILPEERHLEHRFGDAYRAYKSKSRRWI